MRLNEIFVSCQGEGPLTGRRSIFVRLAGCNKRCDFCDSKYANTTTFLDATPRQVYDTIDRAMVSHVVLTGGEPTIQMNDLILVAALCKDNGIHVTLETNGSNWIDNLEVFDLVMVSPKCFEDATKWLPLLQDPHSKVKSKWVCNPDNMIDIMNWCLDHQVRDPYFMPQGQFMEEMVSNSYDIIMAMNDFNLNGTLCTRMQVLYTIR